MKDDHLRSAQATLAAAEAIGRARPPRQDYRRAPRAVREFVKLAQSMEQSSTAVYEEPTEALRRLGASAAPWLKRIVLDGRRFHPQPRHNAASVLAGLGRWDDLMDAMNTVGWDAASAAEGAFCALIVNGKAGLVRRYLAAIEAIARTSLNWPARASAIRILGSTSDGRYLPALTANLAYSGWAALLERARGSPWPAGIAGPLKRILLAGVRHEDCEVRTHSMRCLGASENPAAIPALLEVAERTRESFHRAEAMYALSNIAKRNFGPIPDSNMAQARTACEKLLPAAWAILKSPDSSAPAKLDAIAREIEETVRQELAGSPTRRVLDSWSTWWKKRKASPPRAFKDEVVAHCFFPRTGSQVRLYSSGQVETQGPHPGGSGRGGARFTDLAGFERYVKAVAGDWLGPEWSSVGPRELRASIVRWLKAEALPRLRRAHRPPP